MTGRPAGAERPCSPAARPSAPRWPLPYDLSLPYCVRRRAKRWGIKPPMTVGTSRMPKRLVAAYAIARIADLGLIALGIGFIFLSDTARHDLAYLIGWDVLAMIYLTIGFVVVRRRRQRP